MASMNLVELQAYLSSHFGTYTGEIDGLWGPKTKEACKLVAQGVGAKPSAFRSDTTLRVAVEQAIYRDVGKLAISVIDGLTGPETEDARLKWLASPWRDKLMEYQNGDSTRLPASGWPKQSVADMTAFFGPVGQNIVLMDLPFPMKLAWDLDTEVTRISINERCAASAKEAFADMLTVYGHAAITALRLDLFGGCYNNRPMRGGTRPSTHSWGAAIDFDPINNQYQWDHRRAALSSPEYRAFFNIWEKRGWLSLGRARDFDWMHIQAARLG